jgi:hypothetical protein
MLDVQGAEHRAGGMVVGLLHAIAVPDIIEMVGNSLAALEARATAGRRARLPREAAAHWAGRRRRRRFERKLGFVRQRLFDDWLNRRIQVAFGHFLQFRLRREERGEEIRSESHPSARQEDCRSPNTAPFHKRIPSQTLDETQARWSQSTMRYKSR